MPWNGRKCRWHYRRCVCQSAKPSTCQLGHRQRFHLLYWLMCTSFPSIPLSGLISIHINITDADYVKWTRANDQTIRSALQECWMEDYGSASATWRRRSSLCHRSRSYLITSVSEGWNRMNGHFISFLYQQCVFTVNAMTRSNCMTWQKKYVDYHLTRKHSAQFLTADAFIFFLGAWLVEQI